jgi:DNA (cytosine-5)-methyltransferase 1
MSKPSLIEQRQGVEALINCAISDEQPSPYDVAAAKQARMRYGSVCSGIEAASVAWEPLGWRPAWFAEIEPFPSAVLAHRYPTVPNLGDMTLLPERVASGEIEAPDVLVGGTPCQGFSVAGLRLSLRDERSNLAFSFVRIADAIDAVRLRDGRPAAWITWENVPGVFIHDDNPFGCFLGALVGSDAALVPPKGRGWPDAGVAHGPRRCAAWRCLDAQHFRLAQRRKRLFVVARGYFGGAGEWDGPDALLPVIEGMRWHPAPRREAWEDVTGTLNARTRGGGGLGTDFDCGGGITVAQSPAEPQSQRDGPDRPLSQREGGGRQNGR